MKSFLFRIALILLYTAPAVSSQAQEDEKYSPFDREALDTLEPVRGPSAKKHAYFYLGYGVVAGETEGTGGDIKYGLSSTFNIGLRGKLRIFKWYELGFDVNHHYRDYVLKQNKQKILPNKLQHDKEKMMFYAVNGGIFQRFVFHRRGFQMGKFMDMGAYGGWVYMTRHYTMENHKVASNAGGSRTETTTSGLIFTEAFNYGVEARLGWNHFVLFGKYRLSEMFKEEYIFPELPRYTVGLEIGLHE